MPKQRGWAQLTRFPPTRIPRSWFLRQLCHPSRPILDVTQRGLSWVFFLHRPLTCLSSLLSRVYNSSDRDFVFPGASIPCHASPRAGRAPPFLVLETTLCLTGILVERAPCSTPRRCCQRQGRWPESGCQPTSSANYPSRTSSSPTLRAVSVPLSIKAKRLWRCD